MIPTIEEMYQQYLKLTNLDESKMHETQRIETKRAFFAGASSVMKIMRDDIAAIEDEKEGVAELEKWWIESNKFWESQKEY